MIKRFLSCFLTVVIFASGIYAYAENRQDKNDIAWQTATGLGFISKDLERTAEVTRAEFATFALRLYDEETASEQDAGSETPYSDVSFEHYKSTDIARAHSLGIIKGYGDGCFYPENIVKLSESVKIIMDTLGYKEYAAYKGGYPFGYMSEAAKLGITSGVSKQYNDNITYIDLARIVYNAYDESIVEVAKIEGESVIFNKDKSATLLSKYHDIYKDEGVVTATSAAKVNGESSFGGNKIEINDTVYNSSVANSYEILGLNCEYYYEADGDDCTVVCAIPKDNEIMEIYGKNIVSAGDDYIKFLDENEDTDEVRFSKNGNVIYNGIYKSKIINYDLDSLTASRCKVRITDTDSDGNFDMMFVTEYKNFILDRVMEDKEKILLKDAHNSYYISFGGNTYVTVLKSGEEISLSELESGSLVSIAYSEEVCEILAPVPETTKSSLTIVESDKFVTANVSAISDNEVSLSYQKGSTEIKEVYEKAGKSSDGLYDNFIGESGADINVRSSGKFHIDALGEIGFYEVGDNSGVQYGYIIATHSKKKFDEEYKIKMLSASGDILYYYLAEKVNVDGEKIEKSNIETVLKSAPGADGVKQLIRYELNKEGLISAIDTTSANSDGDPFALTQTSVGANGATYKNGMKTFTTSGSSDWYILSESAKVFVIPTDADADDNDYLVRTSTFFTDNTVYGSASSNQELIMYNVTDAEPEVIVLRTDKVNAGLCGVNQYDGNLAVISKIYDCINDKGEECVAVKVMVSNAEKTLIFHEDRIRFLRFEDNSISVATSLKADGSKLGIDDFKFGDCILFYEDESGEARTILKLSEYNVLDCNSDGSLGNTYGSENLGSYLERTRASVRKIDGRKLYIDVSGESGDGCKWMNMPGSVQVYLVDSETKTVKTSSFNDIIASENDDFADRIMVRVRNFVVKQVVIYR